jgi:hypothetical protein
MENESVAREILIELRACADASAESGMLGDRSEALREINEAVAAPSIDRIRSLLLPTGNLQELAIENGWGARFNELAARLEELLGIR